MKLLLCREAEEQFSAYMDGTLSGKSMADVQEHLRHCGACTRGFAEWRGTLAALAALPALKPPPALGLALRVAVSQEKARTAGSFVRRMQVRWENTVAPLLVQASAGLASAVLMLGTALLLVGTFAAPEQAAARDEPIGMATPPRLLYTAPPRPREPRRSPGWVGRGPRVCGSPRPCLRLPRHLRRGKCAQPGSAGQPDDVERV